MQPAGPRGKRQCQKQESSPCGGCSTDVTEGASLRNQSVRVRVQTRCNFYFEKEDGSRRVPNHPSELRSLKGHVSGRMSPGPCPVCPSPACVGQRDLPLVPYHAECGHSGRPRLPDIPCSRAVRLREKAARDKSLPSCPGISLSRSPRRVRRSSGLSVTLFL